MRVRIGSILAILVCAGVLFLAFAKKEQMPHPNQPVSPPISEKPEHQAVCGDGICEQIEKNCRSTHPVSMDCGPDYCEGDCY